MRRTLLIILTFGLAVCKGQPIDSLRGKYSSTCLTTIEGWSLTLYKKTFEHHYSGHYMNGKVDKGTWTLKDDTLILKIKRKPFKTYLVSKNQLCEILIDKDNYCDRCLIRM